MITMLEKIILIGLILLAVIAAWSVLTPNHLFIG